MHATSSYDSFVTHGVILQVHDAWLCSACLRLVNGNPGSALASRLGWSAPLPATTLGAQLLELGRLHSQVAAENHMIFHRSIRLYLSLCSLLNHYITFEVRKCRSVHERVLL